MTAKKSGETHVYNRQRKRGGNVELGGDGKVALWLYLRTETQYERWGSGRKLEPGDEKRKLGGGVSHVVLQKA